MVSTMVKSQRISYRLEYFFRSFGVSASLCLRNCAHICHARLVYLSRCVTLPASTPVCSQCTIGRHLQHGSRVCMSSLISLARLTGDSRYFIYRIWQRRPLDPRTTLPLPLTSWHSKPAQLRCDARPGAPFRGV